MMLSEPNTIPRNTQVAAILRMSLVLMDLIFGITEIFIVIFMM